MPVTLQKSPLWLSLSEALTNRAVSTAAPELGSPMAEAGTENPWKPLQVSVDNRLDSERAGAPARFIAMPPAIRSRRPVSRNRFCQICVVTILRGYRGNRDN